MKMGKLYFGIIIFLSFLPVCSISALTLTPAINVGPSLSWIDSPDKNSFGFYSLGTLDIELIHFPRNIGLGIYTGAGYRYSSDGSNLLDGTEAVIREQRLAIPIKLRGTYYFPNVEICAFAGIEMHALLNSTIQLSNIYEGDETYNFINEQKKFQLAFSTGTKIGYSFYQNNNNGSQHWLYFYFAYEVVLNNKIQTVGIIRDNRYMGLSFSLGYEYRFNFEFDKDDDDENIETGNGNDINIDNGNNNENNSENNTEENSNENNGSSDQNNNTEENQVDENNENNSVEVRIEVPYYEDGIYEEYYCYDDFFISRDEIILASESNEENQEIVYILNDNGREIIETILLLYKGEHTSQQNGEINETLSDEGTAENLPAILVRVHIFLNDITNEEKLKHAKRIVDAISEELADDGIDTTRILSGIFIETEEENTGINNIEIRFSLPILQNLEAEDA